MPKTFKYKVLRYNSELTSSFFSTYQLDTQKLESQLNELGAEGWNLMSSVGMNITGFTKDIVLILKKEEPASGEQSYE